MEIYCICMFYLNEQTICPILIGIHIKKSTSRQRSGKGAIRKRLPLQKPRWEKKQTNNQALIP